MITGKLDELNLQTGDVIRAYKNASGRRLTPTGPLWIVERKSPTFLRARKGNWTMAHPGVELSPSYVWEVVSRANPPTEIPTAFKQTGKPTNPKDAVGVRKWRQFSTIPFTVMWELGVAMLEGARNYGRHNYRDAGVRASVYVDASIGHITQFWEGEDIDADSQLSHVTKAIASLVILRDGMIQGKWVDDRPPSAPLDAQRRDLQRAVDHLFDKYPDPALPVLRNAADDPSQGAK